MGHRAVMHQPPCTKIAYDSATEAANEQERWIVMGYRTVRQPIEHCPVCRKFHTTSADAVPVTDGGQGRHGGRS